MHSVWLGLVVPIMFFLIWGFPQMRARRIWLVCLAVVSALIIGFAGFDLQQYLAGGGASADSFRRVFFKIVTMTDLPLVAAWIGSLINVVACRWMVSSPVDHANDQTADTTEPEPETFTLVG